MANPIVTSLPKYVDQTRSELIAKAVIGAKSADLFTLMTGVKGETALNLIDTKVTFGDGAACGWDEAGETTLSQRILAPKALKVNMSFCDKVLLDKWANYLVRVEANKTDADCPFEKEFVDGVIAGVKAEIENMIYKGDGTGNQFTGILELAKTGTLTATGTGAYEAVKAVLAKMPAEIVGKEDAVILVGMDTYNEYMQDLVAANLFHYNPNNGENEQTIPGSTVKVIGVNGLNGTKKAIGTYLGNLFYGTNLQDGDEIFDLWFSKDNREFRLAIEFTAGVQIAFPELLVLGTIA